MRSSNARIMRLGVITLALFVLILAATFNLGKFPGFQKTSYQAEFADASGLRRGNTVQIAGTRVGRVQDLALRDGKVVVTFEVDGGVEFGPETSASVDVLNLLGEKYLELQPAGEGQLPEDGVIPIRRTTASYSVVDVLGRTVETTEGIDTPQLSESLQVLTETVDAATPEIAASFDGISRLSRSIASRDAEIQDLLSSSRRVTRELAKRGDDLVDLMGSASLVFEEVESRREAIHQLLVNARRLSQELRGVAADNQAQLRPALTQLRGVLTVLNEKDRLLRDVVRAYGPYTSILGNIIGSGPWFDAYVPNLLGTFSGEFQPAPGEEL